MLRSIIHHLRQLTAGLFLAAIALAVCEALSALAFFFTEHKMFSFAHCQEKREIVLGLKDKNLTTQPQDLHATVQPYFGYVYDPKEWKKVKHNGLPVSPWGFIDDKPSPILQPDDRKCIVGFIGGSVALWASTPPFSKLIAEKLKTLPSFADKEIVFVRLALGGMKQPQQLLLLTYLYSLGAHFDVLINLDGVNEVVEPHFNRALGVNPFYPMNWRTIIGDQSPEMLLRIAVLDELSKQRAMLARIFNIKPLRISVTANYLWILLDRLLDRKMAHQRGVLSQNLQQNVQPTSSESLGIKGQPISVLNEEDLVRQLARNWFESSNAIAQLATARGIPYFHFLQPNQYDTGSKRYFTPEEISKGVLSDQSSAHFVQVGYPLLREKGAELRKSGVNFVDLSPIFEHEESSVYVDSCCHLSPHGNTLLAQAIGEVLVNSLSNESDNKLRK